MPSVTASITFIHDVLPGIITILGYVYSLLKLGIVHKAIMAARSRGPSRIIAYFRFVPASGRRLARKQAPVKFNCFAENFKASQRLKKRKTAALVCLYDFALNDFASVPAPLASGDAPLPLRNE